jgi:hypothetical protein
LIRLNTRFPTINATKPNIATLSTMPPHPSLVANQTLNICPPSNGYTGNIFTNAKFVEIK